MVAFRWFVLLTPALLLGCLPALPPGTSDSAGDDGDTDPAVDADGDGFVDGVDCDDANDTIYPDAEEVCDEVDNDCDGGVDENVAPTQYRDADGDGYGDAGSTVDACSTPDGYVTDSTDCDDADPTVHADADGDGACDLADYTASNGAEMMGIPAGGFEMGCRSGRDDLDAACEAVEALHAVTLTHDFWIGRTEISRAEWDLDEADNAAWSYRPDACTPTADCPANRVSWEDAARYANWLSGQEGYDDCYTSGAHPVAVDEADPYDCTGYRLPTEAEWEYTARAGVDTQFSGSDTVADVAWYSANSTSRSHVSGTRAANAWGLYDMSGNVWEWVEDCYHDSYSGAPADGSARTSGCSSVARVLRGGSWVNRPDFARSAFRGRLDTANRNGSNGFRPARIVST